MNWAHELNVIVVRKQPTCRLLTWIYEENVPRFSVPTTTKTRSSTIQRKVGSHHA